LHAPMTFNIVKDLECPQISQDLNKFFLGFYVWKCHMSVPFVSYHAFMKYYTAEPKNSSILYQSCLNVALNVYGKFSPN
jgi:hypothetical protein